MKKATKFLVLLFVFALLLSVAIIPALADDNTSDDPCAVTNVASLAKVTFSPNHWQMSDNALSLIDGDKTTACPSNSVYPAVDMFFTFDENHSFTKIVLTTMGVGRVLNSKTITDACSGKYIQFDFTVRLFDESDNIVYEGFFTTEEDGETVIELPGGISAYKMLINHNFSWNYSHAFWEVEMFAQNHNWQTNSIINEAKCTTNGSRTIKCLDCGAVEESVIVAPGHKNEVDPCSTTCSVCETVNAVTKTHKYTDGCDTECDTEGCDGKRQEWELPHKWADDNPETCPCGATRCVHEYDNLCDRVCNKCGAKNSGRDGADTFPDEWHVYNNGCDVECNECLAIREPIHTYVNDCNEYCDICKDGKRETIVEHKYDHECDTTCNVCNEVRTVLHIYSHNCDDTCNNTSCLNKRPIEHKYDHECDTDCNTEGCPVTRRRTHQYTSDCDESCNVEGCGEIRTVAGHKYTSDCDDTCDVEKCGATRVPVVVGHSYSNDCDNTCDVEDCGFTRTIIGHVYTSDCDADCNTCGKTRIPPVQNHKWSNECGDTVCDVENCGFTRLPSSAHTYGMWIVTLEAERKTDGSQMRMCDICGFQETQAIPALGGIGAGGIIAIVAGSVAVLGGGGFCLFWFVIRKKFL